MIKYDQYVYGKGELIRYGLLGGVGVFALLMLFYDNILFCGIGTVPGVLLFLRLNRQRLIGRRKRELTVQFRDAMESLVSAMVAGYSLENAVLQAWKDLGLMYGDSDIIMQEFSYMAGKISLNVQVESLIRDLGMRSGVEDILTFGEILATAKKTGGNLVRVMRRTADNISEKIEIRREIDTMVSGKKMESNCMTAIPLLMIIYLRVFSPGFLDPLYHSLTGCAVMTGALMAYAGAFLWGQRIMDINF